MLGWRLFPSRRHSSLHYYFRAHQPPSHRLSDRHLAMTPLPHLLQGHLRGNDTSHQPRDDRVRLSRDSERNSPERPSNSSCSSIVSMVADGYWIWCAAGGDKTAGGGGGEGGGGGGVLTAWTAGIGSFCLPFFVVLCFPILCARYAIARLVYNDACNTRSK